MNDVGYRNYITRYFYRIYCTSSDNTQYLGRPSELSTPTIITSYEEKTLTTTNNPATGLEYEDLVRYNKRYVGKTFDFNGKVCSVYSSDDDEYEVALGSSSCWGEKRVEIYWPGVRLLDDDRIWFTGTVTGLGYDQRPTIDVNTVRR